ncbi:hypothetical protein B9Z55_009079 [Caenorhabditis nigoni]|uniref:Reverse transcriptase domain-containing protein n=1 Tax=Caenorhabditis nigoni TaxID=1611254 RepID=A0A2G5URB8_9PELO|nr:hypothetical protein B9Z55_009079 [Caenorhabditis nigoni]
MKKCATTLALPLSLIYSSSLESSQVPTSWKHAVVIPIPKKGSSSSPENYRPISLTDPFARIFERILCDTIKNDCLHKFSRFQQGFLAQRSCTTSLVHSISTYKSILFEHNSLDVIFFDFRKAFDKVHHQLLIQKLVNFDIPNSFISWFSDFLTGRTFSVKINDHLGTPSSIIPSGVPQGTVSGPLLFIIFINDLLLELEKIPRLHVAAFADDIKLYSYDPLAIQTGIDTVVTWSASNSLPLAESKTALLRLGSHNSSHPFTIVGSTINESLSVRDLGLITDPSLKFAPHINKTTALALLRSKQLLKSFKSNSPSFYTYLFKCYVLPIIEYCSVIYSPPPSSSLSLKLESPLRFFSRIVCQRCNIQYSSYSDRLTTLNMFSIRHRRLKAQLILLYKFLDGTAFFPNLDAHVKFSSSARRPMNLIHLRPNTSDFFSSIIPIWNAITCHVNHFLLPSQFYSLINSNVSRF